MRARFPLDQQLNLPKQLYSHPLRERVADKARTGARERAVQRIDRSTGARVPKRQAEKQTIKATQDLEMFYEQHFADVLPGVPRAEASNCDERD